MLVRVIDAWHSTTLVPDVLKQFAFVRTSNRGEAYISGHEVDFTWDHLLPHDDFVADRPTLAAVIEAASAQPRLRRLLPFTSHDDLRFSRTTWYPFEDVVWIRTHTNAARFGGHDDVIVEVHTKLSIFSDEPVAVVRMPEEAASLAAAQVPTTAGRPSRDPLTIVGDHVRASRSTTDSPRSATGATSASRIFLIPPTSGTPTG